ncbi:unnamed protein product [Polarella glacialis]|uniref:Uncharacterized protein n=1 Tax=Polarella glacialis TaxID=89957 RepID=A0A813K7Q8_POLGL|nr:unnamed protein product [Polarella glacialis]CAE8696901.1 unnamed protein product [Polarella glacialis]
MGVVVPVIHRCCSGDSHDESESEWLHRVLMSGWGSRRPYCPYLYGTKEFGPDTAESNIVERRVARLCPVDNNNNTNNSSKNNNNNKSKSSSNYHNNNNNVPCWREVDLQYYGHLLAKARLYQPKY